MPSMSYFGKVETLEGSPPFPLCSLSRTVLAVLNRTPEMRERGRPHWCSLEHFYLVPKRAIGRLTSNSAWDNIAQQLELVKLY